ncbi:MAG TPA: VOC family protein, partial [Pseudonocardiaceae bacterium]|nr:VOC family protein [Pseudonocardiaceae bacterium]
MADRPWMKLTATVLDSADANALAAFYHALLGWPYGANEPGWVALRPEDGGTGLSFASEPDTYVPPTWPSDPA